MKKEEKVGGLFVIGRENGGEGEGREAGELLVVRREGESMNCLQKGSEGGSVDCLKKEEREGWLKERKKSWRNCWLEERGRWERRSVGGSYLGKRKVCWR